MPRTIDATLKTWLDTIPLLESHSTFKVSLPFTENSDTFYYATLPVNVGGQVYDRPLKSIGELKLSMGRAADRVEVRLSNEDGLNGGIFIQSRDAVRGSRVEIGRYYRNPQSPTTDYHVILFKGTIVSVSVDDRDIVLTVVSDLYAGGMIGATRVVATSCQFVFKDSATCGYVGAETVCNKRYTDAGGCSGRANQHRYGGALKRNNQVALQTTSGGLPAVNQQVKAWDGATTTNFVQRNAIAFQGAPVTDDSANNRTIVNLSGAGRAYAIHAKTDFAAVGNGVADDTAALQAAINSAQSTGRALYIPGGVYKVTGLTATGHVTIFGDGDDQSVIYSVTNAPILNCVGASFFVPVVENLVVRGSKTAGTSQIGIKMDSAGDCLGGRVEKVKIQTTGGSGLYVGLIFSSVFRDIFFEDIEGWPVEINAPFQPCLYFENVYPGVVSASHPAGFYVRQCQNALFNNCNGLNSVPLNSVWMILGRKNGLYGETTNGSANVQLLNCNIESFHSYGIRALRGSQVDLLGHNTFARHNVNSTLSAGINNSVTSIPITGNMDTLLFPASGELLVVEGANVERMTMTSRTTSTATVTRGNPAFSFTTAAIVYSCHAIGIEFDVDTVGAFPNLANKSLFHDATVVQDGPEYFYKNSAFIHSNDLPPVILSGEGPRVTQARPLHSYYNTTRSRFEELKRADGTFPAVKITGTTTFANPGARYIECNFSAPGTVTLPAPSWYESGEIVIVKDVSGNAATNPITVSGGGGSTVGGSSHTINTNGGAVVLMPEGVAYDWRILATFPSVSGSGTADNLMVWDALNKAKQVSGLAYDPGFSALKSPARVYVGTIGSAAFPSIARTGDEDTGIYWPLANVLGFTVGGSDRARLDNALNVLPYGAGAGQTGSVSVWNLANTNAATIRAHDTSASYNLTLPSALAAGYLKSDGSGNLSFDSAVVNGSGAAANLMVWGSGNAASEVSGLAWDAGSSAFKSPGRVYLGTTGSAGFPAIARTADPDTGIYFPSADTINVAAGGADKVQFSTSGMSLLGNKLYLDASNTAFITSGNGSPEGVVTAPRGSFYLRLDGGVGTTVYSKESGAGNTGWVTGSGANTALSNLVSVAINAALIANADNTLDFGSTGTRWRTGYFRTSLVTALLALEARTDPGSPANGDAWTSSDRNAVSVRIAGQTEDVVTSMWRNSASFSFDTTTTETSMLSDTGIGTKTLAANRLKVGNQVRVKMAGTYGTKATGPGNFTIKLKNGATTMATISAFALPANVADQNWWIEAVGTVTATGGTGTILWTINFYYNDGTGTLKGRPYTVNSSTIDTTATRLIDVTGQFTVSDVANFWETVTASIEMVS